MDRKNTVFLMVIAIATLLVAVIGATFAWFSAQVNGNDTASSVIVRTATLGITYTNGNALILGTEESPVVPGATKHVDFTIENDGDDTSYKILWDITTNSFHDVADAGNPDSVAGVPEELVYELECISGCTAGDGMTTKINQTTIPAASGAIGALIPIKKDSIHTYRLTITFKEMDSAQNYNQGREFFGKIKVEANQMSV